MNKKIGKHIAIGIYARNEKNNNNQSLHNMGT